MNKKAFTLSEVMLVLSVIGVIAALTLPGVIQNLNNKQYKTMWRKNFSVISQVMFQVLNESGYTDYRPFVGQYGGAGAQHTIYPELKKYLSISKDCGASSGCFSTLTTPVFNYKDASGRVMNLSLFDDGQYILSNGAFVSIENYTYDSIIWVDVNGYMNGPNKLGNDLFAIKVLSDKIVPFGAAGTGWENIPCSATGITYSGATTSPADGLTCSAEYLQN